MCVCADDKHVEASYVSTKAHICMQSYGDLWGISTAPNYYLLIRRCIMIVILLPVRI